MKGSMAKKFSVSEIEKMLFPSVVTFLGDWKKMLADADKFELKEISLFLTGVGIRERRKLYSELEKTGINRIHHVHARHDMRSEEYEFFLKKYKTKAFTLHYQFLKTVYGKKYAKNIFVENNNGQHRVKKMSDLEKAGGVCIDLSHYMQFKNHEKRYEVMTVQMADNFIVGCNHMSAVRKNGYSWHYAKNKNELNYVKNIPRKFFSDNINIELANPIRQQLEFRKHVAKLLSAVWNKR